LSKNNINNNLGKVDIAFLLLISHLKFIQLKTALIIEDDKDTLDILGYIVNDMGLKNINSRTILSTHEIYKISPHIILLDHFLNIKLRDNLCLKIKSDPAVKHIPVIMLSTHLDIGLIAKNSLADACLSKPFDIADLMEMIDSFIL
jgi:DNA-binding response OmpR family regulator